LYVRRRRRRRKRQKRKFKRYVFWYLFPLQ
jgi:hypothetical protein